MRGASLLAVAALAGVTTACAPLPPLTVLPPPQAPAYAGYRSPKYADDRMWLCRPDLPADQCRIDLTATEIHPDGSRTVVPHLPAAAPEVDCFYVYPTVDLGVVPGNHTDFTDLTPMASTAAAQVARFGEACQVYAPLYRQATIGSYVFGGLQNERLDVAFSDVADAFAHYLGQYNHGRKIALIGHSQGAEMVVRLLRRFFEGDPVVRERLLVAMPIGVQLDVPHGKLAGSTLPTIPVCTHADELGCVVAFRTYRAGSDVSPGRVAPKPGDDTVCVSPVTMGETQPASVAGNERRWFSRAYFPVGGQARRLLRGVEGVTTPFVVYRDFYAGRCVDGADGYRFLEVAEAPAPGDVRPGLLDLGQWMLNTQLGMHILDFQFPQGDLIDMVTRRAAALP